MTTEAKARIAQLAEQRRSLMEDLRASPSGLAWCERHTQIADAVVSALFADLEAEHPNLPPVAVIATGGFGRREMSPWSDIDITVVPSDESSPTLDAAIRALFQDLHSAFGTDLRMDVGYAYRLVSDSPGLDAKTRTGLLDMRLLCGAPELYRSLEQALIESFSAGEFILAKTLERLEMYERYNDTPLVIEPQLKEGAGGLRDFQCANWLREAIGERAARPSVAYDTMFRYRNCLHLLAGKPQDLLSRTRQGEIAETLGTDPFRMMAEVADAASDLHRSYCATREKLNEARYTLSPGALAVRGEVRLIPDADPGEAAVGVAIATKLAISVSDLPTRCADDVHGPAAIYAIASGEATLRNLDRCGLLERLLPELTACRTLVPHDAVHSYTVFEHTLRVVRFLDSLEPGDFLGDLKASINDLEPLYLAALLHDVGKIEPDRSHSAVGAVLAAKVTQRWKLAENVGAHVEWLVSEHLTMSRFIRIRDVARPETAEEFAQIVGDPTRLAMLTLLTWADVNAVGPNSWTPAQDTFLRQLYTFTLLRLQGEIQPTPDPAVSRARLLRQLKGKPEDQSKVQAFLESLPSYYLTSTPPDVVRLHMEFAQRAASGQPTVEQFNRPDLGASDLTVCSLDSPGLLSRMLGVLYAYDLSLLGIRACTTMTEPNVAVDVFTVSFGGRPVPPATSNRVTQSMLAILKGEATIEELLLARGKDPARRQHIFRYTYVAGTPTIIEIRAPRGRGMAFRFSRLLAAQGWNIAAARVGQWAGNAAAAFYLLGTNGEPLTKEEVDHALGEPDGE